MRIVAGRFGGRRIEAPSGMDTRPTTERIRESLMSSVSSRLEDGFEGVCVLDAFAGSGALGLEALSRGAEDCVFFEADGRAFATLKANIATLGLATVQARAYRCNVLSAPGGRLLAGVRFDLVFLDPPYAMSLADVADLMERLASSGELQRDALVVYEHARGCGFSDDQVPSGFVALSTREHGKTGVSLLRYKGQTIRSAS